MEFFEVFSAIVNSFCFPSVEFYFGVQPLSPYIALAIAGGVYVLLYIFRAIGLFTMAKKQGKNGLLWCAFVPFASTFLMGELAGDLKLGKSRVKHIGLYVMLGEIVYSALTAVVCAILIRALLGIEGSIVFEPNADTGIPVNTFNGSDGLITLYNTFSILSTVFQYLLIVLLVFLYIAFFRRYSPLSYVWMVIVCALLPVVTPFLIFAYRNRVPVDYDRFVQERIERMRRARQAQYGPYGP